MNSFFKSRFFLSFLYLHRYFLFERSELVFLLCWRWYEIDVWVCVFCVCLYIVCVLIVDEFHYFSSMKNNIFLLESITGYVLLTRNPIRVTCTYNYFANHFSSINVPREKDICYKILIHPFPRPISKSYFAVETLINYINIVYCLNEMRIHLNAIDL